MIVKRQLRPARTCMDGDVVLGVSANFHDAAAAVVVDGEIVAAAQEERFSRHKGDPSVPVNAVGYCLAEAGADRHDVSVIVFYEDPVLRFDRLLTSYASESHRSWPTARDALSLWGGYRLHVADDLRRRLRVDAPVRFVRHHESHAASAFFPSPFDSAAIVVMDAVGEWATSSIGRGHGNHVELLAETRFPHSLGMLYSAFTAYCGFKVNSGEYKLMGLAPYGQPRFVDDILGTIVQVGDDGAVELDLRYFDFVHGGPMTHRAFHDHFGGPPRTPESALDERHLDLAASIQQVCELAALRTACHARQLTGERQLVMAGGVALNCVSNGRIRREAGFDDVWVQPAAGDAGGALGAALLESHRRHHERGRRRRPARPDSQRASLLGPRFDDTDIGLYLDGAGAVHHRMGDDDRLLDAVVDWLVDGWTVGWFDGRMEFGPRALGSRSIIADPRRPDAQRTVNLKVKFRESFRPFAPSVLAEHVKDLFETASGADDSYMLFVEHLRPELRRGGDPPDTDPADLRMRLSRPRSHVPAVTHVDHSARIQSVHRERHGRYRRLLERFHDRTGCPVLLNTSFNVRGEPIVQSPADAYRCFLATGIDGLVLGRHLLAKREQPSDAVDDAHRLRPTGTD